VFVTALRYVPRISGLRVGLTALTAASSSSGCNELKRFGLRIVLDDFDCGYRSLARLTTLPADGLKIDRSFTRALPDDLKTVDPPAAHLR
jgi:EAL domain-containing protein (putative c-di-GMP-specific phosphodiesterase class I)